MKTNIFFKHIITLIPDDKNNACSKQTLAHKLNIKSHNIKNIIKDFNIRYPNYAIKSSKNGYYKSCYIPQNILDSLTDVSLLNLYIAFTQIELLNSIIIPNYKLSERKTLNEFTIYATTVESTLTNFGIPEFNKLFNASKKSKIYILSVLPYYIYVEKNFEKEIFFSDNSIYNINSKKTFENIKKLSSKYSNNILNTLGDEYKTTGNYYILFFYFIYEFVLHTHNFNQSLSSFIDTEYTIFDYQKFIIPSFCNFSILKSLLIIELHLQPKNNMTMEKSFNYRLNSLDFYPLFGIFTPNNNNLIISTYSIYTQLINSVQKTINNSYVIYKLVLIHLVNFRKTVAFKPQFSIPTIKTFHYKYKVIYKSLFSNDSIYLCNDVNEPCFFINSKKEKILIIPALIHKDLIQNNIYTMFNGARSTSLKTFNINFISSTSAVNMYEVHERLLLNFPNGNTQFYNDLIENLPTKNCLYQLLDKNTIPTQDSNGNFTYSSIINKLLDS